MADGTSLARGPGMRALVLAVMGLLIGTGCAVDATDSEQDAAEVESAACAAPLIDGTDDFESRVWSVSGGQCSPGDFSRIIFREASPQVGSDGVSRFEGRFTAWVLKPTDAYASVNCTGLVGFENGMRRMNGTYVLGPEQCERKRLTLHFDAWSKPRRFEMHADFSDEGRKGKLVLDRVSGPGVFSFQSNAGGIE